MKKAVVFVYDTNGTYSYVAQSVIFRKEDIMDPQIQDLRGGLPVLAVINCWQT